MWFRAERLIDTWHADPAYRDALRFTLHWETDANDVDLHVVDPSGEQCFYSHKQKASGLQLYEDLTQGLGPECAVIPPGRVLERGRKDVVSDGGGPTRSVSGDEGEPRRARGRHTPKLGARRPMALSEPVHPDRVLDALRRVELHPAAGGGPAFNWGTMRCGGTPWTTVGPGSWRCCWASSHAPCTPTA